MVIGEMKEGQTNLNLIIINQAMPRKIMALLFYEVLGLNFELRQDDPAKFSDIMVVLS